MATKESDDKSRRITRKHEELASSGKWWGGGSRPFGYEPGGRLVRESEALVVRECAQRFLAGEPLRSLCSDLNVRGDRGGGWGRMDFAVAAADARLGPDRRLAGASR